MKAPVEENDGGVASSAVAPSALSAPAVLAFGAARARLADYIELTKPRISMLVLLVTAVGFALASPETIDSTLMAHALLGTALVAIGANALNQVIEHDADRLMPRTATRPIPSGRLGCSQACAFGTASALIGSSYLALTVNPLAALLAVATIALYLFAYTPLKRRSVYNTLVGAVPGALPALIGFAAARGALTAPAWMLFAIVWVWQLPHFFAIAWMYREDYARGGFRMLSRADPDGARTGRWVVICSVVLLPASLLPFWTGVAGGAYGAGAAMFGTVLLLVGIRSSVLRTAGSARIMVIASVLYLPALLILMLLDRVQG
ncbi:MAG: heme o synthase [Phycisphaerae bacterium]